MKKLIIATVFSVMALGTFTEAYAKPSSSFSASRSSSSSSRFSSSSSSPSRYESRRDSYNSSTSKPSYTPSRPLTTSSYTPSPTLKKSLSVGSSDNKYKSLSSTRSSYSNSRPSSYTTSNNSNVGTAVAVGAVTGLAVAAATSSYADDSHDSSYVDPAVEEANRLEAERQLQAIQNQKAAELRAQHTREEAAALLLKRQQEKEEWNKMLPKEREAIIIKKLWISDCKDWMCKN